VWEPKIQHTDLGQWRALVRLPRHTGDGEAYVLGQVPAPVRFLTAGQDSRASELHWSVWGWGLLRNVSDFPELVGWLVDCGIVRRQPTPTIEASDLAIFDQLLLDRAWPRADESAALYLERAYFDSGWCPLAVAEYVRTRARAYACKGDSADSATTRPFHRWGAPMRHRDQAGEEVCDPRNRPALLNTYALKTQWFGMVPKVFERPEPQDPHTRICLPQNVPEEFLEQSSSEFLTRDKTGRKRVWAHKGPNHFSDTNVYAYGAALDLNPFQKGATRAEATQRAQAQADRAQARKLKGRPHRRRTVRRSY